MFRKISSFAKKHFQELLVLFLMFSLFLQDRLIVKKIFWNDYFIEYQSIVIYPFFFAVLVVLGVILFSKLRARERFNFGPPWLLILFGTFFVIILVTGFLGLNFLNSLYFGGKILLGFLTYLLVLNLRVNFNFWQFVLIFFIVVEGIVGIGQLVFQRDLGLNFLFGEPNIDPSDLGIATVEWSGHRLLRAYGNFAHPNIFGGVMAAGLIFLVSFYLNGRRKLKKIRQREKDWFFFFGFLVIYLGLFFSFSRSAWLPLAIIVCVSAVGVIIYRLKHSFSPELKNKILKVNIVLLTCLVLSVALFSAPLSVRFDPEEPQMEKVIKSRGEYFKESFELGKSYWLKGTGAGNYVKGVFDKITSEDKGFLYQPVHNVPVLVLIETGVIGIGLLVIFVIYWVWELFKKFKKGLKSSRFFTFFVITLALFVLAFANLFDHYLWTSMIGFFLVWILVGLGARGIKSDS